MENDLKYSKIEVEDTLSSDVIKKPFDPKRINITTKQMPLYLILKRLRNDEVDLDTFFQRNPNLWDRTKQSRLIESILIRLPLPAFYFDGSDDNKWLVVDGLQRLSAFKNFIIEKSKNKQLVLRDLEYLTQFNGYTFDELPRDLKRRIEECEITVYIINEGTPDEVKYNLFRRINTGGLTLTPQEIRNALNQGIPTQFINELSEIDEFKSLRINPERMLDQDFITRFLAFYLFPVESYKPDLDDFLNRAMSEIKKLTDNEREIIKSRFRAAMKRAQLLFGEYAFRKREKIKDKKRRLNKALFETFSVVLSKLSDNEFYLLLQNKDRLTYSFIDLLQKSSAFESSISSSTGDPRNVQLRHYFVDYLLKFSVIEYVKMGSPHFSFSNEFSMKEIEVSFNSFYYSQSSFYFFQLNFYDERIVVQNDEKNIVNIHISYPIIFHHINSNKARRLNILIRKQLLKDNSDKFNIDKSIYQYTESNYFPVVKGIFSNNTKSVKIASINEREEKYSIVFEKNCIILIKQIVSIFDDGAVHGLWSENYHILDSKNEKFISIYDILYRGKEDELIERIRNAAKNNNKVRNLLYHEDVKNIDNVKTFYFDSIFFYFVYQPYDIGPSSSGVIQIPVPITELEDLLLPNSIIERLKTK